MNSTLCCYLSPVILLAFVREFIFHSICRPERYTTIILFLDARCSLYQNQPILRFLRKFRPKCMFFHSSHILPTYRKCRFTYGYEFYAGRAKFTQISLISMYVRCFLLLACDSLGSHYQEFTHFRFHYQKKGHYFFACTLDSRVL